MESHGTWSTIRKCTVSTSNSSLPWQALGFWSASPARMIPPQWIERLPKRSADFREGNISVRSPLVSQVGIDSTYSRHLEYRRGFSRIH